METKLNYNFTKSFSLDIWGILNTPLFIIISHFSQNFLLHFFYIAFLTRVASSQSAITYSKLTIKTLEQGVKYVHS